MEAKDEGGSRMTDMPSVDTLKNFMHKWIKGGCNHPSRFLTSAPFTFNLFTLTLAHSSRYTVTQLPGAMNNESTVPCPAPSAGVDSATARPCQVPPCMACGPVRDQFIETNLWISNGESGHWAGQLL
jgi:hypothetical protein